MLDEATGRFASFFGYISRRGFELASNLSLSSFRGLVMLDEEFRKQRARTVRDLAEKAADPFIKGRLLDLASRYEDDPRAPVARTPVNLQFESRGTGPER